MNQKFTGHPFSIRAAGEKGMGIFADAIIPQGAHLFTLTGQTTGYDDICQLVDSGRLRNDDPLHIGEGIFLILDSLSNLFNHSCDPNLGVRREGDLFALRDILPGEELCYDYTTTVPPGWSSADWSMGCCCGSAMCRGILGDVLTLPSERLDFYLSIGALTDHVLQHLPPPPPPPAKHHHMNTSQNSGLRAVSASESILTPLDLLRQRRDAIYTPLEEAVEELHNRRRKFAGRTPGRDWLPDYLPKHPNGYAFHSRYAATPNFETRRFLNLVDNSHLLPVIAGSAQDKFVTHNPIKRALARIGFHGGVNRHGQPIVEFMNLLNADQQGLPLGSVRTLWGQSLILFHQELFAHALNGGNHPVVFDNSQQYARAGGTSEAFYRKFLLRLCMADGILFEDFLLSKMERNFTRDVVLPAFESATVEFGLRPLIVRLTPPEEEDAPHWFWYPGELKTFVKERMERMPAINRSDKG